MEEFAINLHSSAVAVDERTRLSFRERVAAYAELTKPRITFLIVLTSAAGFALASIGSIDYVAMLRALLGIGLLSSGIATLNQYAERDLDGLMRRTATRPLPAGKLAPWEALACPHCSHLFEPESARGDPWDRRDAEPHRGKLIDALGSVALLAGTFGVCRPAPTPAGCSSAAGNRKTLLMKRNLPTVLLLALLGTGVVRTAPASADPPK